MKTGLVSVTFRKLSPIEIIQLASRCGLDSIEWGGDIHVPAGDLECARKVGALTRENGLEVACYGSYERLTGSDKLEQIVETAKALGAPLIRVWAGTKGSADASAADRDTVCRHAQQLAELAAANGMEVAFEYHGGTLTDTANSALSLLQAVDRPNVGTMWQPPVGMSTGDCLDAIRKVAPYIRNIHVFSWNSTERLPLAQGADKWRACLAEISRLPGEHRLMLEFVRGDEPAQLAEDAACLLNWTEGRWHA